MHRRSFKRRTAFAAFFAITFLAGSFMFWLLFGAAFAPVPAAAAIVDLYQPAGIAYAN